MFLQLGIAESEGRGAAQARLAEDARAREAARLAEAEVREGGSALSFFFFLPRAARLRGNQGKQLAKFCESEGNIMLVSGWISVVALLRTPGGRR